VPPNVAGLKMRFLAVKEAGDGGGATVLYPESESWGDTFGSRTHSCNRVDLLGHTGGGGVCFRDGESCCRRRNERMNGD